jgi:uncharacterized protein YgiB involved in biofilm formation
MTLSDIRTGLFGLNESELLELNGFVISELKTRRARSCAAKRFLFKSGDKVSWTGRRGYTEGVVVRVKRKKAIVDVIGAGGFGTSWDIPLNMLSAA